MVTRNGQNGVNAQKAVVLEKRIEPETAPTHFQQMEDLAVSIREWEMLRKLLHAMKCSVRVSVNWILLMFVWKGGLWWYVSFTLLGKDKYTEGTVWSDTYLYPLARGGCTKRTASSISYLYLTFQLKVVTPNGQNGVNAPKAVVLEKRIEPETAATHFQQMEDLVVSIREWEMLRNLLHAVKSSVRVSVN